jgi:mono/diheme cytochrome c family protein
MHSRFTILLMLFFVLLAGCGLQTPAQPATHAEGAGMPMPPDLAQSEVTLGTAVYADQCAECHGANLEGEAEWKTQNDDGSFRAPPHTADGHTWHHPDSVLLEAIREGGARFDGENISGTSDMPAFGDTLSEQEIIAVLAFIKSTWSDDVRAMQWAQTLQDQAAALPKN